MLGLRSHSGRAIGATRFFSQRSCARARAFDTSKRTQLPVALGNKRHASTEIEKGSTGESQSGHINAGPNEGIFFLQNVYPLKLNSALGFIFFYIDQAIPQLNKRFQQLNIQASETASIPKRALPKDLPISVKINEVIPCLKEGGAFIKFSHSPEVQPVDVERLLRTHLKENPVKPWFNPFTSWRTHLVQGRPWIEDMVRIASPELRVEFVPSSPEKQAADISQETLYGLFRKYGKLRDITPQPKDSKELPKYATLYFLSVRHAIMAKNCMHGYKVPSSEGEAGTILKIGYSWRHKEHWIRDWFFSHPRIVIPLVFAFFGTIAVSIFDPIRTYFIKVHVIRTFDISGNKVFQWLRSKLMTANDLLHFRSRNADDAGFNALWEDRKDDIERIRTWLIETADTFIVIQGPRGSGKKELVMDQALAGRKHTLLIDCKPIQEARGDSATIGAAAAEVGYRPVFSWMNSFSSLIDLAAQGTIGTKTGFSETLDTQLAKIWQNTATALKQIALEDRSKDDKDSGLSDDEYLEAHPERRPVVVIDNFLHKSQESSVVYDKLSEWAARLTTANIAHVIFLTGDVSFSKSLSKALPDRVFRQISLGDCTPEVAKRFVINHLDADPEEDNTSNGSKPLLPSQKRDDLNELDECISVLGGRLTDLEFLARRIKTGETPKKSVTEIIKQSASEILKMHILDLPASHTWTASQAWHLIKSLAHSPQLRYNELLQHDLLKSSSPSPDSTLQSLEQAELITILSSPNGRPDAIKPGKPVYAAAFQKLVDDQVLAARLDLGVLAELTKIENAGIEKVELELERLAKGLQGDSPREVRARVKWLLGKLEKSQTAVEGYEREAAGLKKVLGRDF